MAGNLKVMSTLAVELALKRAILPAWEDAGNSVEVDWNPTGILIERVRNGERGDILIAIDSPITTLADEGILLPDTIRPVARASFGLAARAGSSLPDISTPERFKAALLAARSVAYSLTGASGLHFQKVLDQLGIAETVRRRAVTINAGFTAEKIISGEAELAVQQISELMSVDGVDVIGPFPAPFQKPTDFSAAVFSGAKNPKLAAAFLDHLSGAAAIEAYERSGLKARFPAAA
ncbi:molybdate ABC transporter substrate-binding protein [Neorhizobium petrolearium]|uniref:molybdate ABC transporter substrate-binding protein n=1 Tax=Neorhizobium petrolearium TaxID=515361 RepID=UPI003F1472A3